MLGILPFIPGLPEGVENVVDEATELRTDNNIEL